MLNHIKNSEAGRNAYEVVSDARFRVTLIPPAGVTNSSILTEQCISCTGWRMPGPEAVQQNFARSKRNYASPETDNTQVLALTFELNLNKTKQNYVYNTFRQWKMKVFNPLTGEEGLKADYIGTVIIEQYLPNGDVYWVRTVKNAWPTGDIESFGQNDVATTDPAKLEITLTGDWYEEETL